MKMSDAFASKYLKAADLQGQRISLVINHVTIESVGKEDKPEDKPIVYFMGKQKGLVLNVTNKNVFVLLYGKETTQWTGRQIELYPSQTDFRGEVVACIRCRAPGAVGALGVAPVAAPLPAVAPAANGGHTPVVTPLAPKPPPEQTAAHGQSMGAEIDDEIPFAPLRMLP